MAFPILKRRFAERLKARKYRNRKYRNRKYRNRKYRNRKYRIRIKMKGMKPVIKNMKRKIRKLK